MTTREEYRKWKEELTLQNLPPAVFNWLVDLVYWYGTLRGMDAQEQAAQKNSPVSIYKLVPKYKKLTFHWNRFYGCLDLCIEDTENRILSSLCVDGQDVNRYRVLGQNEELDYSNQFIVDLCTYIEQMVHKFFPGIKQANGVKFCSMPNHLIEYSITSGTLFRTEPLRAICTQIGNKWLCSDCVNRYTLRQELVTSNKSTKKEQTERAKMTPSLRFSILERDSFTCKACGRSPQRGDDVKLHVDHIMPIAKGGKTEPQNLQILCDDCNQGKGTRIVEQMMPK